MHDPRARIAGGLWKTWKLPGDSPRAYAVYVDEKDMVWVSDFGANAVVRFDPRSEKFESLALPARSRQRAPDPRPAGRGVAARERHRAHRR